MKNHQTKTMIVSFITGMLFAIPVEALSHRYGHVVYPNSLYKLPAIDFPVSGLFIYGIYAVLLYQIFFRIKSRMNLKPAIMNVLIPFLLASLLSLVMEYLATATGYMEYTEYLKAKHDEVRQTMPVKLSIYIYYMAVINFPLLTIIHFAKRLLKLH